MRDTSMYHDRAIGCSERKVRSATADGHHVVPKKPLVNVTFPTLPDMCQNDETGEDALFLIKRDIDPLAGRILDDPNLWFSVIEHFVSGFSAELYQ